MSIVVPATKSILNILLPTMLPMAISVCPFFAAVHDVTSSGRDVPNATIVRPMSLSVIPSFPAIYDAAFTVKLLPTTTSANPMIINSISLGVLSFSVSSIESLSLLPFFALMIRYTKNPINTT